MLRLSQQISDGNQMTHTVNIVGTLFCLTNLYESAIFSCLVLKQLHTEGNMEKQWEKAVSSYQNEEGYSALFTIVGLSVLTITATNCIHWQMAVSVFMCIPGLSGYQQSFVRCNMA